MTKLAKIGVGEIVDITITNKNPVITQNRKCHQIWALASLRENGDDMAAILAAILDFYKNQFLGHSKLPHQRKIVEYTSLG